MQSYKLSEKINDITDANELRSYINVEDANNVNELFKKYENVNVDMM